MNEPRKKNPTFGLGVFIVAVVLIVIGIVLFNAIRSKREYDASHVPAPAVAASAAVAPASAAMTPASATVAPASGAAQ